MKLFLVISFKFKFKLTLSCVVSNRLLITSIIFCPLSYTVISDESISYEINLNEHIYAIPALI